MEINVLEKNESYSEHTEKLKEEVAELIYEIHKLDKGFKCANIDHAAEETLDVIQVCVGIIDKLELQGLDVPVALKKHNDKLKNRGWKFKSKFRIMEVF